MTEELTQTRKEKIVEMAKQVKKQRHHVQIRAVARLVGLIVASDSAVTVCFLHYRELERAKIQALAQCPGSFNAYMALPSLQLQKLSDGSIMSNMHTSQYARRSLPSSCMRMLQVRVKEQSVRR